MRSFSRVVLPILLVAGVVFGLTIVMMLSPDDDPGAGPRETKDRKAQGPGLPLKFFTLVATAPREEKNERTGEMTVPRHQLHLKYWDPEVEVGGSGHYPFWCQNKHDQPVTIPAAGPAGPQVALVRLGWTGKAPAGGKAINALVYHGLGEGVPAQQELKAEINV